METLQVLPDDILRKQVCQECHNYLSVPPVVISKQGETICGRCVDLTEHGQKTKSLFNIVASGLRFKCVNHFNGCAKILTFGGIKIHEEECTYEPQQCIFCSYSGNVSQIFNHAVKVHPENVLFDGIVPLQLSDYPLKKSFFLSIIDNNLLVVRLELTERLFRVVLKLVAKELPFNMNQYAMKFYKREDQESSSDYGLFSISLNNIIEKPREELIKILGLKIIECQIMIDTFTYEKRELELQRRVFDLQRSEEHITELERKLSMDRAELLQQRENYDLSKQVIKKMLSYHFFECSKCSIVIFGEIFFCPKDHCYCKSCLSKVCIICNVTRKFSRLSSLEEFTVSCDWPGCDENIRIKDFQSHKKNCNFRPYKCPIQHCNKIILSIEKFKMHCLNRSPTLIVGNEITIDKYCCVEYYLIWDNDIYHLKIHFNNETIQVCVEEYNMLRETVQVKCMGLYGRSWTDLEVSESGERYQVDTKNYCQFKSLYISLS